MSFIDEPTTTERSDRRKTEFMKITDGINVIRVVQPKPVKKWTHYIGTSYVECLGQENCPVCKNNKALQMEYPETYKKEKSYNPARRRYYVNVIDRTAGKICPQCHTEFKGQAIPVHCPNCEFLLADVPTKPLNVIKVLASGPVLFEDGLNTIDKVVVDPTTNEPIGIMNYDVVLNSKGTGVDRVITPVPGQVSAVDITGMELFDIDAALLRLEANEILDLQRGVSLKDIFSARRANSNADAVVNTEPKTMVSESIMEGIQDKVSELFKE